MVTKSLKYCANAWCKCYDIIIRYFFRIRSIVWCDIPIDKSEGHVRMWCTVSFRGNWAPVMEWRGSNMSDPVNTKFVENRTNPNHNVTYTLTVPSHLIQLPYTCTTEFIASMRPASIDAQNIPDYTVTWTSPANMNVSGDYLECSIYIGDQNVLFTESISVLLNPPQEECMVSRQCLFIKISVSLTWTVFNIAS